MGLEASSAFLYTLAGGDARVLTYYTSLYCTLLSIARSNNPSRRNTRSIIQQALPESVASAADVAQLYRGRWSVETLFQIVTKNFECEIQTLGYPKAALFSFCLALVSYNILAVVRMALGSVHGVGKIESSLSESYES